MKEATNINILGLELDKYMNWKNCVEKILSNMSSTSINFMVTPCINNTEPFILPTDAHNVKKRRVIKTF